MPTAWATPSASAISMAYPTAARQGTGPRAITSASVGPATSSMTIARCPPTSTTSWMAAMWGWFSGGERARFALEAGALRRIVQREGRENFEGDIAAQPRVARAIDLAHAAFAQFGGHLVRTD